MDYLIFIPRCDADQDILDASSANVRHLQSKTSTGRGVEPKCVCVMHHFNSKKYTIYGKNTNIEEKNYSEIGQRGCGDDGTGLHYDAL